MKYFLLFLFLFSQGAADVYGIRIDGDEVFYNREEGESLDVLSDRISSYLAGVDKTMPESVKAEIMKTSLEDFPNISAKSLEWVRDNIDLGEEKDPGLLKAFKDVVKWSGIRGDDIAAILRLAFHADIHKREFVISDSISDRIIAWRETTTPEVKYSPSGQGEINWAWKLESTKKRKYGVLHVGIDLKKRTFVCYESDVGLYFPEGETMERIYAEIVQEPDMAGIWLGKGFKDRGK